MTDERSGSLKELQELDLDLERIRSRIAEFVPLLEEVEEPALALEQEVTTLHGRLQEMKLEERRLERAADDRRTRLKMLKERQKSVRNLREEEAALQVAQAEVAPRRARFLEEQKAAQEELGRLEEKRASYAARVPSRDLQSYERIRGGGRSVAVATLTADGACGHCFGMIPLQVQNEIRSGKALIPCESCGVLLGPGDDPQV